MIRNTLFLSKDTIYFAQKNHKKILISTLLEGSLYSVIVTYRHHPVFIGVANFFGASYLVFTSPPPSL